MRFEKGRAGKHRGARARLSHTKIVTQHSGQALSLASLQFHGVQIHIEFERLERCIVTSGPNVVVRSCGTGCCLTNADLSACIETTYVYLDDGERNRFATTHFEVLMNKRVEMGPPRKHVNNRGLWTRESLNAIATAA